MIKKAEHEYSDKRCTATVKHLRIFKYAVLMILVLLIVFAFVFHSGDFGIDSFNVFFSELKPEIRAEACDYTSVIYDNAKDVGFLNCRMAVLGKNKLELFDKSGKCYVSSYHGFSSPTLLCCDSRAILYDKGGNTLSLYDKNSLLSSRTYDNSIRFVGLCENGSFSVVTSEGIYRSTVYTFNSDFELLFKWQSGDKSVIYAMPNENGYSVIAYNEVATGNFAVVRCSFKTSGDEEILRCDGNITQIAELGQDKYCLIGESEIYFYVGGTLSEQHDYSVIGCAFSQTNVLIETTSSFMLFSDSGQLLSEIKKESEGIGLYMTDRDAFILCPKKIIKLSIDTLKLSEYHIDYEVFGIISYDTYTALFTPTRVKLISNEKFN